MSEQMSGNSIAPNKPRGITKRKGSFPHVYWIDLDRNGVMIECVVMKEDANGNIYYFELSPLDTVDKRRIHKIITHRNAQVLPLYEVMGETRLRNGMRALDYFHQLVKVITPSGVKMDPRDGAMGI